MSLIPDSFQYYREVREGGYYVGRTPEGGRPKAVDVGFPRSTLIRSTGGVAELV